MIKMSGGMGAESTGVGAPSPRQIESLCILNGKARFRKEKKRRTEKRKGESACVSIVVYFPLMMMQSNGFS